MTTSPTATVIPVVFESADVLVVDKPPGMVVVPARGDDRTCLRHLLEAQRGEPLWVVHRIDRDTSGLVLFARNAAAHRVLSMAMERHEVHKTYLALTRGAPPSDRGSLHTPLHAARKGKMRPALPGEASALTCKTDYTVLRRWQTALGVVCWIDVRPHTGRQHQIRVHMRYVGAPLLVDPLYGRSEAVTAQELGLPVGVAGISRLSLHASALDFPSPEDGARVKVSAPMAADLADLMHALDARASLPHG